jgi:uncharacterized protein (DUF1499 family)
MIFHKNVLLICVCWSLLSFTGCSGSRPKHLGIKDAKFALCPDTPNCISSQSKISDKKIAPMPFHSNLKNRHDEIINIVKNLPRTNLITNSTSYLHFEFTSKIMRFVDDVEFYFDESNTIIHIKSASRLGQKDFGVNKNRIKLIRKLYNEKETKK